MPDCRVCSAAKEASEFYPRQLRKDGAVGECKECTKSRVRMRARLDDKVREYERARYQRPERKAVVQQRAARWNEQNPEGYAAHTAVSNAVRDGRLKKEPCLFCGQGKVHAHHRDYARPLDVIWLCPKCHHRLHKVFPETEGANKRAEAR
jgi:ribosomal protein S27AE